MRGIATKTDITGQKGIHARSSRAAKRRQRRMGWASAVAVLPLSTLLGSFARANSELDVINGQSNLNASGTYTQGAPTTSSDLTFDANTTYSPTTFTGNSALNIGTLNDLDATQTITISNGINHTTSTLTLYGGNNTVSGDSADLLYVASGGNLSIAGAGTFALNLALNASGNFDLVGNATISSIISGGYGITMTGGGILTLTGASTFTGALSINSGTVQLGSSSTTGALSPSSSITDNGTLVFYRSNAVTQGTDFSSAGITGTGSVTQRGSGNVIFNVPNSYSGATTISAGSLTFQGSNALPSLSAVNLGVGTLNINNDGSGSNGTISLGNSITTIGNGTISVGNDGNASSTGNTVAFGALSNGTALQSSSTAISFTGTNGYLESFTSLALTGGTGNPTALNPTSTSVIISGNVTNQQTTFSNPHYDTLVLSGTSGGNFIDGTIADSSGYAGVGSGDTRIAMTGTGTWTLAGANTYHGPTSVTSGGTLDLTGSLENTAISTSGTGSIFSESSAGSITGIATFTGNSTGTSTLAGANSYTGLTTLSAGTLQLGNALAIQDSTLTMSGGAVSFAPSIGNFTVGGLSGSGNIALADTGGAAVNLNVGNNNATTSYSGTLSGNGSLTIVGSGNLTLSATNTYSGITSINSGTLTLSGAGNTNIPNSTAIAITSGGTLKVGGISGAGGFTLNTGQVLGGNGTVSGNLTVASGSTISAGFSAALGTGSSTTNGILSTGNETWNAGGNYSWKISSPGNPGTGNTTTNSGGTPGTNWDDISMTGNLTLPTSGTFTVAAVGNITVASTGDYNWIIAQSTGNFTTPGTTNLLTVASPQFTLDTSGLTINGAVNPSSSSFTLESIRGTNVDDLVLSYDYSGAPEPGTALLVLTGGLPAMLARRRRPIKDGPQALIPTC